MSEPIINYEPPLCIRQERAYSDGWRDCAKSRIIGGRPEPFRKFYIKGWTDHQQRDKCAAMYARRLDKGL